MSPQRVMRRIAAVLLIFGPFADFFWSYRERYPFDWKKLPSLYEYLGTLSWLTYFSSGLLIFAGFSLLIEKSWARRTAIAVLSIIMISSVGVFFFDPYRSFWDLVFRLAMNGFLIHLLYREEFPPLPKIPPSFKGLKNVAPAPKSSVFKLPRFKLPEISKFSFSKKLPVAEVKFQDAPTGLRVERKVSVKIPISFRSIARRGEVFQVSERGFWLKWETPFGAVPDTAREVRVALAPDFTIVARYRRREPQGEYFEFVSLEESVAREIELFLARIA